MSSEVDWLENLHRTDPWIAAITPERIQDALSGFSLQFADGWNWERLTSEIQDMANVGRGNALQGDAAAKKELRRLAGYARALANGLPNLGDRAANAVMFDLLRSDEETRGQREPDYGAMLEALAGTARRTENALLRAASQLATNPTQPPRWTQAEAKSRRVMFAIALTPIFEGAFGTHARAINWDAEYGIEHPWPQFFRCIYMALFPKAKRLNLSEVLQEAARELPQIEAMKALLWPEATRDSDCGE
jgi:hypothetical protein